MKEFDQESLSTFNGKDSGPVYVAYKGRVIDVSGSKLWKTGVHMKRHQAGNDLTPDIEAAPHGPEVLDRYPQVGILAKKESVERSLPNSVEKLMERFPFLRRHPHPMMVHFPIVFSVAPAFFYLLYFVTAVGSFEITAFHCLGAGILFSLPAIATGFFTWWVNYQAKPMKAVKIKILCSCILLAAEVAAFLWRSLAPGPEGIAYFLLLLSLVPIVSVIGWYGSILTFPLERK